jgi:cystathionine beta-lyase family protein involved in aluminum resistance
MEIKRSSQRSAKKGDIAYKSVYKGDDYKIRWNKASKSIKLSVYHTKNPDKSDAQYAYDVSLTIEDIQKIMKSLLASIS